MRTSTHLLPHASRDQLLLVLLVLLLLLLLLLLLVLRVHLRVSPAPASATAAATTTGSSSRSGGSSSALHAAAAASLLRSTVAQLATGRRLPPLRRPAPPLVRQPCWLYTVHHSHWLYRHVPQVYSFLVACPRVGLARQVGGRGIPTIDREVFGDLAG